MPGYKLISFALCPYVQRSAVMLLEKGVEFDLQYVELRNKPDWFLKLSPLGKVPTLVVTPEDGEQAVLFESLVINEYLDEVTDGQMLPEEPLAKAYARAWIEFGNSVLSDTYTLTSAKDEEALEKLHEKLLPKLDRLEAAIDPGPFFLGAEISLVDVAFVPALQRMYWANELYPALGHFERRPRLKRWWTTLADRPSVQGSVVPDLRERFEKMIARDRGGYQSVVGARVGA